MKPERWQQIEALFHAAREREPHERPAFLAAACGEDSATRSEVESLLMADEETMKILDELDEYATGKAKLLSGSSGSGEENRPSLIGQQLGAYRVLELIGKGGMGVVYRGIDTRLDREVAIKVLPASFLHSPDRLLRFSREARATSALNHPNILTVFDIGFNSGTPFIVEELLVGAELRSHLNKGALPVRKAVEYAQQIAAGLAAAHDKGIIHRDLKPENLFVTNDGRVKILDFGIAKLRNNGIAGIDPDSPDQNHQTEPPLTGSGIILGTISYMSPEQVKGQEADQRSDIFAFGIILYEMLSGKRPFSGQSSSAEILSAILKEEPVELREINAKIPPQLEHIVQHCLEKNPDMRFQSVRDLGFALEAVPISGSKTSSESEIMADAPQDTARTTLSPRFTPGRFKLIVPAVILTILSALAGAFIVSKTIPNDERLMKFEITPPENVSFEVFSLSPDGRWLAFIGTRGSKTNLWVRALNSSNTRELPETEGARYPFWSPDSRWLAFFADNKLKKLDISGGPAEILCDVVNPTGGAWGTDGNIIFSFMVAGLRQIPAVGGEVKMLTTLDSQRQELSHHFPSFLPDGRHFLYTIVSANREVEGIYLGSFDGMVKRKLLSENSSAQYARPGYILFRRGSALMAQPLDTVKLQFTGDSFVVADQIGNDPRFAGRLSVSVSDNGLIALDPYINRLSKQLIWLDRAGNQTGAISDWWPVTKPSLSPDEKQFVADRRDPKTNIEDLFIADLSGEQRQRFTIGPGIARYPIWSPDGGSIFWTWNREDSLRIFRKSAIGAGNEEQVSNVIGVPTDLSPDGRFLIFEYGYPKTPTDIWVQPLTEKGQPFPFIQGEGAQGSARLSPDGQWMAYVSEDYPGSREVFIERFPDGGSKLQVSKKGGVGPHWRRDGRELFYYSSDGYLMAVPVLKGKRLELGSAEPLFEFRPGNQPTNTAPYTVTADGQRFLVNAIVNVMPRAPLTILINWTAGVRK
jgi:serine/threonine protein kinase